MSDLGEADSYLVRTCRDCGQVKPLADFHVSPRRKYGRGSYCQLCFNERSKQSYRKRMKQQGREVRTFIKPPEGHRRCPDCEAVKPLEEFPRNKSGREGYGRYCLPCHNARGREDKIKNHGSTRGYHLKRRYRITPEEFDQILAAQGGKCAICGAPGPEHVDHDHLFGNVRGILCFKTESKGSEMSAFGRHTRPLTIGCNGGLGQFKDDVATLSKAITYLKETSCQRVLIHPGVYRLLLPRRACLPSRIS